MKEVVGKAWVEIWSMASEPAFHHVTCTSWSRTTNQIMGVEFFPTSFPWTRLEKHIWSRWPSWERGWVLALQIMLWSHFYLYRLYINIIALSGVSLFSDMYREEAGVYVKIMIFFWIFFFLREGQFLGTKPRVFLSGLNYTHTQNFIVVLLNPCLELHIFLLFSPNVIRFLKMAPKAWLDMLYPDGSCVRPQHTLWMLPDECASKNQFSWSLTWLARED